MSARQSTALHPHALAVAVLLVSLLITWFAYAPGIGGSLHFDDYSSLQGLADIQDSESALRFVASGVAGPLGRPLALASFVPQAYAWPDAPDVFLRTNILIHLINGALLSWFLYLLGRARNQSERQAALVASGAGALWMLLPLLASSSLFIVQRMTTLSAMCMLVGAVAYMYARRSVDRRPFVALLGMTAALGVGASFGVLAKENGALLFLYILATEATLLHRPHRISRPLWRGWFAIVLIAPLVAISFYLVSALPYAEGTVLRRGFTGLERLITQAEILWKYLYLAFMPNVPSLGPFHDDYPVQRNLWELGPLLTIGAWFLVVFAAVKFRQKAPLFTFAVTWFLLGHLLESTTLSLELYFEHRNYLPLVGPVYALVASLAYLNESVRKLAVLGITAYAAMLAAILFSTTSLWGSPVIAAEMWQIHKPESLRATQNLSAVLIQRNRLDVARRVLKQYVDSTPEALDIGLQILVISCQIEPEKDQSDSILLLEKELRISPFRYSTVSVLQQLYVLASREACATVDRPTAYLLGQSLLENPSFNNPVLRHNIHTLLARIKIDERNFAETMKHMELALSNYYWLDTLRLAINVLNSGGRHDLAHDLLDDAVNREAPRHPVRAYYWKKDLAQLKSQLPPR